MRPVSSGAVPLPDGAALLETGRYAPPGWPAEHALVRIDDAFGEYSML
jgi:hypothetical protein